MTPGQRVAQEVSSRRSTLQFYVDSLTGPQRSKLAARYLRRLPDDRTRLQILRSLSIAELAFCEAFHVETYGC